MMSLNLRELPFSYRGSYMAISYIDGVFNHRKMKAGLYLRNIHGSASDSFVARICAAGETNEANYSYEAVPEMLKIYNDHGSACLTFADDRTILVRGDLELGLDFMSEGTAFTFAQPLRASGRKFWLVNSFQSNCRYMLRAQKGTVTAVQKWEVSTAKYCRMELRPGDNGEYLAVLEENFEDWQDRGLDFDFDRCVEKNREIFGKFRGSMPAVPKEYEDAAGICAYVDWASIVRPCGLLQRESMFMSKNWMCNVWSWDHCFNALALAYNNPKEAWDQFMVMFDYQKASGNIPDSVNDCRIIHNFCKPPIHGWTLRKLMRIMELSQEQLEEAYDKLSRWTAWWLNRRDGNGDGLCEYTHGNDSGWDNATAFGQLPPATLPDLAAFLVLQMDVLREVAEKLGNRADAAMWESRSKEMLQRMLTTLFVKDRPAAFAGYEMTSVPTDSLILYLPIVLGDMLPEAVRTTMIADLKSRKFATDYGLATESPESELYESDGYWRGPIWAPSTMLILDGLKRCGETEFVRETTRKFCDMVSMSGCAENFDAKTGQGLRDRAYTWTASVMLVMAHEYL